MAAWCVTMFKASGHTIKTNTGDTRKPTHRCPVMALSRGALVAGVHVGSNDALRGGTAGLLASHGHALDAQVLGRLLVVPAALSQRLLAVHHACPAQSLTACWGWQASSCARAHWKVGLGCRTPWALTCCGRCASHMA